MALIDTSYFYWDLSIAQIADAAVSNTVQKFIDRLEPKLLTDLFGYELYKKYLDGISAGTQKYVDIRDGKEYTNRAGKLTKWRGLREVTLKQSLIACYVYWHYQRNEATTTTGTGEKTQNAQNAVSASPRWKLVRAWNQMVEWNCELVEFLLSMEADYPEFLYHYSDRALQNLLTPVNPLF
jgi:hypothetical protein